MPPAHLFLLILVHISCVASCASVARTRGFTSSSAGTAMPWASGHCRPRPQQHHQNRHCQPTLCPCFRSSFPLILGEVLVYWKILRAVIRCALFLQKRQFGFPILKALRACCAQLRVCQSHILCSCIIWNPYCLPEARLWHLLPTHALFTLIYLFIYFFIYFLIY
jgi:hypothetical protein